ncbi:MAG: tetratricopeptide repeat protein [Spirochaetales bacterium]|nr:tetratricopeptide repeat protein [Spirochaetales bacterium]
MKRLLFFFLVLVALNLSAQEIVSEQKDVDHLLEEATRAYQSALEISTDEPWKADDLFKRSIQFFQGIVDAGIKNGAIYYNMGNAYFRINDLGKAILYYKKALEFSPGDANLLQNLTYARSKRIDSIQDKEEVKILKTLLFFHFDLSSDVKTLIFVISFVGVWVLAALMIFIHKKVFLNILIGCALVSCFFFVSMTVDQWARANQTQGVILAEEVVARKGDSASFEPSFQEPLHSGTEFIIVEERQDWLQIELNDGRRTWLPRKTLGLLKEI